MGQTRKIIRKTRKPVQKQIGTKMVDTFELVEEKNPATMRMSTEFAEPYIKRDGYVQENCGVIGKTTTKVIRQTTVRTVSGSRSSHHDPWIHQNRHLETRW